MNRLTVTGTNFLTPNASKTEQRYIQQISLLTR